jgi:8-oxo-dGTP pyrophosphatase MutT (NUDIX family)
MSPLPASSEHMAGGEACAVERALSGHRSRRFPAGPLRSAAVLLPLVEPEPGAPLDLLFIQRSERVPSHAGQVAFPGGTSQSGDGGRTATALREAHEEVGLPPHRVEIIGRLDDMITITGFHVRPVVGVVRGEIDLRPDPVEVADIFTVPLRALAEMRPERRSLWRGRAARFFLVYRYGGRVIWGATAAMVHKLLAVVRPQLEGLT